MATAAKLLEEAMRLPEDEREELAAKILDSLDHGRQSRSKIRTKLSGERRRHAVVRSASLGKT